MYYLCENYYKPITVPYYIANYVSWVPRVTLLDLRTNWTYEHALGMEPVHMQGTYYIIDPLCTQFLCILSSASVDSTNFGSCSTIVFTTEKYLHISGPKPFKPTLFKGQL